MKNHTLFLVFLLLGTLLGAQSYDISNYKARYERRPLLEIYPSFRYSNTIYSDNGLNLGNNANFDGALAIRWEESSNTDSRIRTIGTTLSGDWEQSPNFNDRDNPLQYSGVRLNAGITQFNYSPSKRFWGFSAAVITDVNRRQVRTPVPENETAFNLNPGIFIGTGRIEFAEDALLANWIMDDLLDMEVIGQTSATERLALAQRITSIIGNRTFDFRRRRIFELDRLRQVFDETGTDVRNEFLLFAILNDNWAFANRAALPNGSRVRVGMDFGLDYLKEDSYFGNTLFEGNRTYVGGTPYVEYVRARILKNKAAGQWSVLLSGGLNSEVAAAEGINTLSYYDKLLELRFRTTYDYIVLPSSRTRILLSNGVEFSHQDYTFGALSDRQDTGIRLVNALAMDYFINYNIRLGVSASLLNSYNFGGEFFSFSPFFSGGLTYAIF